MGRHRVQIGTSKVTHVATPPAPWKGMGKPFPLHPKPYIKGGWYE